MRTVYKFACPMADQFQLLLPSGAELLHFDNQHNEPVLWALVDPEAPPAPRSFRLAGTGHLIEEPHVKFVGTAQFRGGSLVFHLFEIIEKAE
jgi:hypothetical protein